MAKAWSEKSAQSNRRTENRKIETCHRAMGERLQDQVLLQRWRMQGPRGIWPYQRGPQGTEALPKADLGGQLWRESRESPRIQTRGPRLS